MVGEVARASLLTARDQAAWDSVVSRHRHDFYHSYAYVVRCADDQEGEAIGLSLETGRGSVFVPLILRGIEVGGKSCGRDAISPYGYPGPLVAADAGEDPADVIAAAAPQFASVCRELDLVSSFVRMHPLLTQACDAWSGWGDLIHQGDTVTVDLTLNQDEWWRMMRKGHKQDIRTLLKNGFVAEDDSAWTGLEGFIGAYAETMERVKASKQYFFPRPYFAWLREAFGERARLITVSHEGQFAAAAIFVHTGPIVQYHLAATRTSLIDAAPGKLILHYAPGFFAERGATHLHLGGGVGGRNDGLLDFKRGFGTCTQPFYTLRTICDAERYAALSAIQGAGQRYENGFFPAYRASAPAQATDMRS